MVNKKIAICLAGLEEAIQTDSIISICKYADSLGYGVEIIASFEELSQHNLYEEGEKSVFELLNKENICGVIHFPETIKDDEVNQKIVDYCKQSQLPIVCVDRDVPECHCITYGYQKSFEEIVEHLITQHGCKTFYMMAGIRNNSFSDERIDAARRVIEKHGLKLRAQDIGYGNFWEGPTRENILAFLESGRPLPDAFIAANDTMAITIISELLNAGYKVPDDVIVTGFDGIAMEKYVLPRLTTAQQNVAGGMKKAVDYIDGMVNGTYEGDRVEEIPFEVRCSMSCGCQETPHTSSMLQVQSLYNQLSYMEYFFKNMYEMQTDMTAQKDFLEMAERIAPRLFLMEGTNQFFVVLDGKVVENDERIVKRVSDKKGFNIMKDKEKRILLTHYEANTPGGLTMPLVLFDKDRILPEEHLKSLDQRSYCLIPLHSQDFVLGYLCVEINAEKCKLYVLNYAARILSFCIENVRREQKAMKMRERLKQTKEKLEELYIRDSLTDIFNRRGFFTELKIALKKKKGYVCMLSIDLDRLKYINDTFGHTEGDFAIKSVARALEMAAGESGLYARFGGDEFTAAIFAGDRESIEEAKKQFVEAFQACLDNINLTGGKAYPIAASCGCAFGEINESLNVDQVLSLADEEMYTKKRENYRIAHVRSEKRGT